MSDIQSKTKQELLEEIAQARATIKQFSKRVNS
jgi:hypothetical protein